MFDDKEAVECSKREWHRKEVEGGDHFAMVARNASQRWALPSPCRWVKCLRLAGDGRFGDLEAKLEQLAVDTGCSPAGIFHFHSPNEQANLCADLGPALGPGPPMLKQTEASTVLGPTGSGLTRIRALAQPEYQRRSAINKSQSRRLSPGRGCFRLKTASCWRRATDSNASMWRGMKKARMCTIMGTSKLHSSNRSILMTRTGIVIRDRFANET